MWGPRVTSSTRLSARSSSTTTASSDGSETDPFASPRRSLSSFDSLASKRTVTRALSMSSDSSWIKKKRSGSSDGEAPPAVVKAPKEQLSALPLASETQRVAAMTAPGDQPSALATAPQLQHATVVMESESQPSTFSMACESKATYAAAMASDYSMSSDDEDFDSQQPTGETIRVTVRFRPLLSREKASGQSAWSVHPQTHTITQVAFSNPSTSDVPEAPLSSRSNSRRSGSRSAFAFDEVYQECHSTQVIYNGVARSIARSALDGVHGSLFAYGQTSSGKTFTMQGSSLCNSMNSTGTEPETESDRRPLDSDGIIQLAVKDLFDEMARRQAASQSLTGFTVKVSYIEIYNETVRDLLSDVNTIVNVREHPMHGVFTDASERVVSDARGVLAALKDGEKSRAVGATNMNERSSRSHTLFRMAIESRACASTDHNSAESVRVGCLNFVDLAGSESAQRTGARGQRQVEAGNINRSLLALSRVVHALSSSSNHEASPSHIGFRDSKLTRILQPSLSGVARVLFICCVSPAIQFVEDTKSTLKFASRAKRIQIHAGVNEILNTEDSSAKAQQLVVQSLQQENESLRKDLEKLKDAQELATSLKKQIQMMEMEMLIRGGESRESLTGLLSSLELRESFRNSDCTSAFMLEEDDDEYDDEYCGCEHQDGVRYDSEGEVQPEEERESIGDMRASFFVENLIDPNEMTDDEEDYEHNDNFNSEPPETVVEPEQCQHCEELQRQIEAVKELQTQQLSQAKADFQPLKGLEEAQQRVQQLETDCVTLQKLALETETSSQKKLRELESELAHANKLSLHQKQLIDAFQTQQLQLQTVVDPADDEERLLLAESGGVLSGDREQGSILHDRLAMLLTPPGGWGRLESMTLLMALVLISATLYVTTGLRW